MNEIEKAIFQSSDKWFFLKSFFFDEKYKVIKLEIYPNDNTQQVTSFIFQEVEQLSIYSEQEEFQEEFPKQIVGIDYDSAKNLYMMNCGEVEYSFVAKTYKRLQ